MSRLFSSGEIIKVIITLRSGVLGETVLILMGFPVGTIDATAVQVDFLVTA